MTNKYIEYKGVWLQKGSEARELFDAGKLDKLDKHMKNLDLKEKETLARYK